MYRRAAPGNTGAAQRVFIATPAVSGVDPAYTFALFHSAHILKAAGIDSTYCILANDCHVDDARNRLVREFLDSDCTDMVFIDADLRWEPEDLLRLLRLSVRDDDVVGATYPLKQDEEKFPILPLPDLSPEIQALSPPGTVRVAGIPTGFMRIRRKLLEDMAKDAPKFSGKKDRDANTPLIFERALIDGVRWGGDYNFCRKVRTDYRGRIFLMPEAFMEHVGDNSWMGSYGAFERRDGRDPVVAALEEIRKGLDRPETYLHLLQDWDNGWAIPGEALAVLAGLCRKRVSAGGRVAEFGSGISSLVMAAANPDILVYACEHDGAWLDKVTSVAALAGLNNLYVIPSPIRDGWYLYPPMPGQYDMILVDGPPRKLGDRSKALHGAYSAKIWCIDDVSSNADLPVSEDQHVTRIGPEGRFAIITGSEK